MRGALGTFFRPAGAVLAIVIEGVLGGLDRLFDRVIDQRGRSNPLRHHRGERSIEGSCRRFGEGGREPGEFGGVEDLDVGAGVGLLERRAVAGAADRGCLLG